LVNADEVSEVAIDIEADADRRCDASTPSSTGFLLRFLCLSSWPTSAAQFLADSSLEGDGFELLVPLQRGQPYAELAFVFPHPAAPAAIV
jgi:hypothetical protein